MIEQLLRRRLGPAHGIDLERGTSPSAFMMIFLIVLMVFELAVVGGRLAGADAAVSNAAHAAARQGSVVQSKSQVAGVMRSVAEANLNNAGQNCAPILVTPLVNQFAAGGYVEVTVECTVKLSELSGLGIPLPDVKVQATHREVVETFRATEALNP